MELYTPLSHVDGEVGKEEGGGRVDRGQLQQMGHGPGAKPVSGLFTNIAA